MASVIESREAYRDNARNIKEVSYQMSGKQNTIEEDMEAVGGRVMVPPTMSMSYSREPVNMLHCVDKGH